MGLAAPRDYLSLTALQDTKASRRGQAGPGGVDVKAQLCSLAFLAPPGLDSVPLGTSEWLL